MMSFKYGMQSSTDSLHQKNHEMVVNSVMNIRTVKSCELQDKILAKYSQELD